MSILSAGTSNTTSLIYTGDTTGAMVFQTNGTTEAMRIGANQNVGIGVTNPGSPLTVSSAAGASAIKLHGISSNGNSRLDYFDNTGATQYFAVSAYNAGVDLYAYTAIPMIFSTNGTERMRIDSSGRVTMPFQPVFHAQKNNGPQVAVEVITFNVALTNVGSCYSTSTSRFTAPIAGTYHFYASVLDNGAAASHQGPRVALRVNGTNKQMQQNFYGRSDSFYNFIHIELTLILAANDYVDLYNDSGGPIYGSDEKFGYFGGYLLG
jgi:hypothetical protein